MNEQTDRVGAPECEHALSLTEDYRGPQRDCPLHGSMSRDAPERIWIGWPHNSADDHWYHLQPDIGNAIEYVRADLISTTPSQTEETSKMKTTSKALFRFCWSASLGGLITAIPLLILLYLGDAQPRYSWTIHFWEMLTVGLAILCAAALWADLKARSNNEQ